MAIDIMSLQTPAATLVHSDSAPASYRISADKVKADLQKAKENGEIKDLLQLSGKTPEDIKGIQTASGEVRRLCNYSVDSFFTRDMPQVANGDGTYTIGGVNFTEEELVKARSVMKAATDGIGAGVGKNINLDYRNYAEMALAENAVNQYAKENLNEEQQKVVAKAMKEYNAGLLELQDGLLAKSSYIKAEGDKRSDYYGLTRILSEEDAAVFNKLKEELSKVTGKKYQPVKAGDVGGSMQVATNKDLIKNISDLFKNVDLSDKQAVNNAMKKYQELVRPANEANGVYSLAESNRISGEDTKKFQKMLDKIAMAASYKAVDYKI